MKKILLVSILMAGLSSFVSASDFEVQTIGVGGRYSNGIYKMKGDFRPIPLINLNYNGFFLKGLKPGYRLYEEPGFNFSLMLDPLGGYFEGWSVKGSDMKSGYKDIDERKIQFMYGLNIDYDFTEDILGNMNYMWGEHGSKGEASLTYVYVATDRIVVLPTINFKYFNGKFMEYYVGVSNKEAAKNSGIKKSYTASDSFTAGASLTVEFSLTEQFMLSTFAGFEYFDNKIADSPIVDKDYQAYGGIGLRYSF